MKNKPHIVMIIPRGEAVRNFLYSDTLKILSEESQVTILSIIDDEKFLSNFKPFVKQFIHLKCYNENLLLLYLRTIILESHFRWLWSKPAQNHWQTRNFRAKTIVDKIKWNLLKGISTLLATRKALEFLTSLENNLTWFLRPNDDFVSLFKKIKPNLVFNTSHIHGPSAELPVKIAHRMGIPTVGFIFSWDNLTTRSRIICPYDYYLVWNKIMKEKFLKIYPFVKPERVIITGTPQFDFHFKQEFWLDKDELCQRIGVDSNKPFILYTTGMNIDFPEEHRTVEFVAKILEELDIKPKPQLVVRTYIKGTSSQMRALAEKNLPNVVFAPMLWEERWLFTPLYEDLFIYTNLLRYCCLGINPASTVSLELMMFDKPVINLGFDPPGSKLPPHLRWIRHINYDHYVPVVKSGATMVAYSVNDLKPLLIRGISQPQLDSQKRKKFIEDMFEDTLDGRSGERVAKALIGLLK